jgi:hypothetical protein
VSDGVECFLCSLAGRSVDETLSTHDVVTS